MTLSRETLQRRWIHSHEEDTDRAMVFRPDDREFPPSRGRTTLELRADGSYVESAPGPVDRPEEATGTWELEADDTLELSDRSGTGPKKKLRIASAEPDRLVIER